MPTTPPTIDPAPTLAPQRGDRTTFSARVDAFIIWLIAAVAQFAAVATNVYNNAVDAFNSALAAASSAIDSATSATASATSASASAASAATALNAPGTNATSTTSLAIGAGTKTLTIQTGKALVPGMEIMIARTSDPATRMQGPLTSYNSGTGALVVEVASSGFNGAGTFTDWSVSLAPRGGASLGANTFTGAQNFAKATVASSATTSDIWGAAGNLIDWTGVATTTGFPAAPQAGATRVLIAAGACSFTAGANMLIGGVASGNTFACAAGDRIIVEAITTTQFKLTIAKYDGTAVVATTTTTAQLHAVALSF